MNYISYVFGFSNMPELAKMAGSVVLALVLGVVVALIAYALTDDKKIRKIAGIVAAIVFCFIFLFYRNSIYQEKQDQLATLYSYRSMGYNTIVNGKEQLRVFALTMDTMYQYDFSVDKERRKIIAVKK